MGRRRTQRPSFFKLGPRDEHGLRERRKRRHRFSITLSECDMASRWSSWTLGSTPSLFWELVMTLLVLPNPQNLNRIDRWSVHKCLEDKRARMGSAHQAITKPLAAPQQTHITFVHTPHTAFVCSFFPFSSAPTPPHLPTTTFYSFALRRHHGCSP